MKKIYYFSLSMLAMAALAVSCNKNMMEEAPAQEPVVRTFTCTFADPDTKVAIDNEGKTTWEVGDVILIHGKKTSEDVTVTLAQENILENGKKASFSVALPATSYLNDKEDPNGYYAAYPASAYIENTEGRGYHYNTFSQTNLPLMSAYLNAITNTFAFHNLCGILSFKVSGGDAYDSYILSGNGNETVGYSKYAVKTTSDDTNYHHSSTSGDLKSIAGTLVTDGVTENKIYFPNGVSFSGGFTIKFLKSGTVVKTLSTTKSVTIARNKYRPMGDITSKLKDYVPPTSHDSSIDPSNAIELDINGHANCYIIDGSDASNADQVFKFKAFKGNSTTIVGTINTTEILWETYNDDNPVTKNSVIASVDYDVQEGGDPYIVFQTPAPLHVGNALIAAKDISGKILWSWHIWVPETLPVDAYYGFSKKILDRNIGALDAPTKDSDNAKNAGFFYQWGRKDPLRTVSSLADGTLAQTYPNNVWTTSTTQIDVANMHETPCVFIKNNTDWCSTRESTLWTDYKTVNDPCPLGYKVPKYGETSLFDYFTIANYPGWSVNDDKYNFTIGTEESYAVFPFGHITRYGAYDLSDNKAWIWTATHKSETEPDNARAVTVNSIDSRGCSGQRKANGVYVRCVAE